MRGQYSIGALAEALSRVRSSLEGASTGSRLARGAMWSITGAGVSRVFAVLASVVTARILEREGFGRLGVLQATLAMFQTFAGAGMGATATKYVAEFRFTDPQKAGGIALLSQWVGGGTAAIIGGLLWTYSSYVAGTYLGDPSLAKLLEVASIGLVFATLNGAQNGALAGLGAFDALARVGIVSGIGSLIFSVVGVLYWGLDGAVWALVASAVFQWALTAVATRAAFQGAGIFPEWRRARAQHRVVWAFALPAVLSGIMVSPINWWATAMLARQPNGLAEIGGLSAATQWLALIAFIPGRISAVTMPMLSERLGQGDRGGATAVLKLSLLANALVVIPLVMGVALLSKVIMGVYGHDFSDAWLCLVIVALTGGIIVMASPFGDLIAASGRMWIGFAMNAGWAAAFLALLYLLKAGLPLTAVSVAGARFAAYVLHAGWVAWYGRRQLSGQGSTTH
jgi:O-antigen/teichoic acid export membrane protein